MAMRMTIRTRTRVATQTGAPRGRAILFFALLMAVLIFFLCLRLGFARYAFTAYLWQRADGVVMNTRTTSDPTIEFAARDGTLHTFSEDYILLCGHRSLCWWRNFAPREVVPVVYDPGAPHRAFVRDWALYSTIFEWFVEAFLLVLIAWLVFYLVRGRSTTVSFQTGSRSDPV
jgi:hypothetical protein